MSRKLYATEALRLLRKVAKGREDFVYDNFGRGGSGCQNFRDGQPSCIVGHVLAKLGLTYEKADELGIAGSTGIASAAMILGNAEDFGWTFEPLAVDVLRKAQYAQDSGESWGTAVNEAASYLTFKQLEVKA